MQSSSPEFTSKLHLEGKRVLITADQAVYHLRRIFSGCGCQPDIADAVAHHLVDASLCGVESHGIMRCLQYAKQFRSGYMDAGVVPMLTTDPKNNIEINGNGGIGIPAMTMAYQHAAKTAATTGISMLAIRNLGHTGRHGAFADAAAEHGLMTILIGGGNRAIWRQVAPYGGAEAKLPTNPYCIGFPGGDRGSVVLDFATSKIAGGWIYAAQNAGADLPADCVIDKHGSPTTNPDDYFDGGAILPSGEQKGYALALMAELIAEALLGKVKTEANWLLIAIDTRRYQDAGQLQNMAEHILDDMRQCQPAPGFHQVEIPGERERHHRNIADGVIPVPEKTWADILVLESELMA